MLLVYGNTFFQTQQKKGGNKELYSYTVGNLKGFPKFFSATICF